LPHGVFDALTETALPSEPFRAALNRGQGGSGRMTGRRDTVAAEASAAILAGIGIYPASAEPIRTRTTIDRELCLSISDGFTRQTWRRQGHSWSETRDVLSLKEHECIRITVLNDMPGLRVVSLGGDRMLRIPSGELRSATVLADSAEPFVISVVGQPALSRPVRVRTSEDANASA
jgi:hypothetical protein